MTYIHQSLAYKILSFLGHIIGGPHHIEVHIPNAIQKSMVVASTLLVFCEAFILHTHYGMYIACASAGYLCVTALWSMWNSMRQAKITSTNQSKSNITSQKYEQVTISNNAWHEMFEKYAKFKKQALGYGVNSLELDNKEIEVLEHGRNHKTLENQWVSIRKEYSLWVSNTGPEEGRNAYGKKISRKLDEYIHNLNHAINKLTQDVETLKNILTSLRGADSYEYLKINKERGIYSDRVTGNRPGHYATVEAAGKEEIDIFPIDSTLKNEKSKSQEDEKTNLQEDVTNHELGVDSKLFLQMQEHTDICARYGVKV